MQASTAGTDPFVHVELLLKGPELDISDGRYQFSEFHDKGGKLRSRMRVRWWSERHHHLSELFDLKALQPEVLDAIDADQLVSERDRQYLYTGAKPVIFGHHWHAPEGIENRDLVDFASNALCVDFSAAKEGGYLAAYQFNEGHGPTLSADNLIGYRPR